MARQQLGQNFIGRAGACPAAAWFKSAPRGDDRRDD
jgi:hypothetical protein